MVIDQLIVSTITIGHPSPFSYGSTDLPFSQFGGPPPWTDQCQPPPRPPFDLWPIPSPVPVKFVRGPVMVGVASTVPNGTVISCLMMLHSFIDQWFIMFFEPRHGKCRHNDPGVDRIYMKLNHPQWVNGLNIEHAGYSVYSRMVIVCYNFGGFRHCGSTHIPKLVLTRHLVEHSNSWSVGYLAAVLVEPGTLVSPLEYLVRGCYPLAIRFDCSCFLLDVDVCINLLKPLILYVSWFVLMVGYSSSIPLELVAGSIPAMNGIDCGCPYLEWKLSISRVYVCSSNLEKNQE